MFDEAKLGDLLLEWDERRKSGDELSVEQLCGGCEELIPALNNRIDCLRATDWLFEEDEDDENLLDPSTRDTVLPRSSLTVDEFTKSVVDSGLLSSAEIQQLKRHRPDDNDDEEEARQLAQRLVADGKLTKYQASVLLQNKSDPLLIDKYLILDVLGSGGMGVVFKALHKAMDRVVALKILPKSAIDSPDKVARFQREVKAAAKLSHPNIVTAHDADESKGIHFLVMEYVQGDNLDDWVNEHGPATVSEAIDFTLQAARGLAHAHERGIVHRDIKPANLILDTGGTVKHSCE